VGKRERKRPLEDLDASGRIMDIGETEWNGMIDLAQDRDQWRFLAKTIMNLWVP
jgi:hypothetical protein